MFKHAYTIGQIFLIYSTLYLIGLVLAPGWLTTYWKWTLLPVLMLAVVITPPQPVRPWLLAALGFSWLGDIIISFAPRKDIYFLGGVVCFLFAHLCYLRLFWLSMAEHVQSRGYPTWAWSLVAIFTTVFLVLMLPKLGAMSVPVIVYSLVISAMLIFALKAWAHWPLHAGNLIVAGAASFALSDTVLAVDKFHTSFPFASVLIMATYLFAQWALTQGILSLNQRRHAA